MPPERTRGLRCPRGFGRWADILTVHGFSEHEAVVAIVGAAGGGDERHFGSRQPALRKPGGAGGIAAVRVHCDPTRSTGVRRGHTDGPGAGRSTGTHARAAAVVVQLLHTSSGSGGDLRSGNAARDQLARPARNAGHGFSARLLVAAHVHFDGLDGGADPGAVGGLGGANSGAGRGGGAGVSLFCGADVLCDPNRVWGGKPGRGLCGLPLVGSGCRRGGVLGTAAIPFRVAGVPILSLLRVLLPAQRVCECGRGPAKPAELSPDAGSGGNQSARCRGAVPARVDLPTAAADDRGDSAVSESRCH